MTGGIYKYTFVICSSCLLFLLPPRSWLPRFDSHHLDGAVLLLPELEDVRERAAAARGTVGVLEVHPLARGGVADLEASSTYRRRSKQNADKKGRGTHQKDSIGGVDGLLKQTLLARGWWVNGWMDRRWSALKIASKAQVPPKHGVLCRR